MNTISDTSTIDPTVTSSDLAARAALLRASPQPSSARPSSEPAVGAGSERPAPIHRGVTVHADGNTQWWFDARGVSGCDVLQAVEHSNCTHILVNADRLASLQTRKQPVAWVECETELSALPTPSWVLTPHEAIRQRALGLGHRAGLFMQVSDLQRDFGDCVRVCERGDDFVVIDIEHATYIPYELLLAKVNGRGTQVLRSVPIRGLERIVDTTDQSLNALATMEQGVGVLFRGQTASGVDALSRCLAQRQARRVPLLSAQVTEVQHTGLGHRVCVDTTSVMSAEEGMLVGSTGWGGLFVCSETHHLPHMNLREFRVNAGAVHSYIWSAQGQALYLSEMRSGSEVLCVDRAGNARVVSVGRAKIERRPMLRIACRVPLDQVPEDVRAAAVASAATRRQVTPQGEHIAGADEHFLHLNAFLQNDWHVRVMGADGVVRHCTLLQPGDQVMVHVDVPGRHTGLRVSEHILEH